MSIFRKVSPGTPASQSPARSSAWLNAVTSAAAFHQEHIAGGAGGAGTSGLSEHPLLVKVRNDTGQNLLRGHAVQLGEYLLNEIDHRHLWFEGKLIEEPIGSKIAIIRAALKADGIGAAQMLGVCTAMVNVTDVEHTHAKTEEGEILLASAKGGVIQILSPLTEEGEQEVAVLLGSRSSALQWGVSTSAITASSGMDYGTGNVQFKDTETRENDGDPVEVRNPYLTPFTSGSIVCCDRGFDPPVIVSVGCPAEEEE